MKNIIIAAVVMLGIAAPGAAAATGTLSKTRAQAKVTTYVEQLCNTVPSCIAAQISRPEKCFRVSSKAVTCGYSMDADGNVTCDGVARAQAVGSRVRVSFPSDPYCHDAGQFDLDV